MLPTRHKNGCMATKFPNFQYSHFYNTKKKNQITYDTSNHNKQIPHSLFSLSDHSQTSHKPWLLFYPTASPPYLLNPHTNTNTQNHFSTQISKPQNSNPKPKKPQDSSRFAPASVTTKSTLQPQHQQPPTTKSGKSSVTATTTRNSVSLSTSIHSQSQRVSPKKQSD